MRSEHIVPVAGSVSSLLARLRLRLPSNAPPKLVLIEQRLKDKIWRKLYGGPYPDKLADLVSFDVFDTLIMRPWYLPREQFAAIGPDLRQAGLFSGSDLEWMELRFACEAEARLQSSQEDISLRQIYVAIGRTLDWSESQLQRANMIEFDRELKDIRPIALAKERLAACRSAGHRVIVTSDTYFSGTEIAQLLARCGYEIDEPDIFTSSEHGLTKATGGIFAKIMEVRGIASHQLHHLGDHPLADGRAPANLGIASWVCDDYAPTRYERLFASNNRSERLTCSALAGSARASRLSRCFRDPHSQTIWNVGTNVAGPLLLAYVLWVLQQAREQHIDRIYFLARDGEILLKIARRLCEWLGWSIDCRYLYASRQAFFVSTLTTINQSALDWILQIFGQSTLRIILRRIALQPDDIKLELAAAGFNQEDQDRLLSRDKIDRLGRVLTNPNVTRLLLSTAHDRRQAMTDYLVKEGMTDGTTWAICDVGWRGFIQHCLGKLVVGRSGPTPVLDGFYFSREQDGLHVEPKSMQIFQECDPTKIGWILEAFCGSAQGSLEHFVRDPGGDVLPIFNSEEGQKQGEWGVGLQQAAIMQFADEFTRTLSPCSNGPRELIELLRRKTLGVLDLFRRSPSDDEAKTYGQIDSASDPTHDVRITIAPMLPRAKLAQWLLLRHYSGLPWINWPEGSIRRSTVGRGEYATFEVLNQVGGAVSRFKNSIKRIPMSALSIGHQA